MTPVAERVAAGIAFLDQHDPGWHRAGIDRAISLDTLDLLRTDMCILGQRCPLDALARVLDVENPDELGWIDMGQAYAVNAARLHGPFESRLALQAWAVSHGFNAPTPHRADYDALAAEWARVIRERRSA